MGAVLLQNRAENMQIGELFKETAKLVVSELGDGAQAVWFCVHWEVLHLLCSFSHDLSDPPYLKLLSRIKLGIFLLFYLHKNL